MIVLSTELVDNNLEINCITGGSLEWLCWESIWKYAGRWWRRHWPWWEGLSWWECYKNEEKKIFENYFQIVQH